MSKNVGILISAQTADDIQQILAGMSAQARLLSDVLAGATRRIGVSQAPAAPQAEAPPQPPTT